jgi:hypothetical protein
MKTKALAALALLNLVAIALLAAMAGCARVPPARVLPATIQSVNIPIFENLSYEPGLEERLTRFLQEECLADGRLEVVSRPLADAVLTGRIKKFAARPQHFSNDEFPLSSRIYVVADIALYDPSDEKREKPLMQWKNVDVEYSYISDVRLILETSPQDAIEEALRVLARALVMTVMNTPPTQVAPQLASVAVPALAVPVPAPAPPRPVLGTLGPSPATPPIEIPTTGTVTLPTDLLGQPSVPALTGTPGEAGRPGQIGGPGILGTVESGVPDEPNSSYSGQGPSGMLP